MNTEHRRRHTTIWTRIVMSTQHTAKVAENVNRLTDASENPLNTKGMDVWLPSVYDTHARTHVVHGNRLRQVENGKQNKNANPTQSLTTRNAFFATACSFLCLLRKYNRSGARFCTLRVAFLLVFPIRPVKPASIPVYKYIILLLHSTVCYIIVKYSSAGVIGICIHDDAACT